MARTWRHVVSEISTPVSERSRSGPLTCIARRDHESRATTRSCEFQPNFTPLGRANLSFSRRKMGWRLLQSDAHRADTAAAPAPAPRRRRAGERGLAVRLGGQAALARGRQVCELTLDNTTSGSRVLLRVTGRRVRADPRHLRSCSPTPPQPAVSLYFDRNPLTSAGGVALAEMLRHNCELAELSASPAWAPPAPPRSPRRSSAIRPCRRSTDPERGGRRRRGGVGADDARHSTVRLLDVTANRLPDDAKAELREVAAVRGTRCSSIWGMTTGSKTV